MRKFVFDAVIVWIRLNTIVVLQAPDATIIQKCPTNCFWIFFGYYGFWPSKQIEKVLDTSTRVTRVQPFSKHLIIDFANYSTVILKEAFCESRGPFWLNSPHLVHHLRAPTCPHLGRRLLHASPTPPSDYGLRFESSVITYVLVSVEQTDHFMNYSLLKWFGISSTCSESGPCSTRRDSAHWK